MNRIFSNQKDGTLLCCVSDDKAASSVGATYVLLKIKYREVRSEALSERVGMLVSGKSQSARTHRAVEAVPDEVHSRKHVEPLVLFYGFSGTTLDAFLVQTRKQKPRLLLKIALTETSVGQASRELYDAIHTGHETMTGEVL